MERVRQLLSACEHGEAPVVQTLLDEGIDVDCEDDEAAISPLQVRWKYIHVHDNKFFELNRMPTYLSLLWIQEKSYVVYSWVISCLV